MSTPTTICRYSNVPDAQRLHDAIDAIFFEASNTKSFPNDAERRKFRERWLGRYLTAIPQHAYLAVNDRCEVQGYLVGSLDRPSPDTNPFADCDELLSWFPAHLHVNIAPRFRNLGLGGRLIDAFVADAKEGRAPGAHVITSAESENVRFYERNGFLEAARRPGTKPLVFLARTFVTRPAEA